MENKVTKSNKTSAVFVKTSIFLGFNGFGLFLLFLKFFAEKLAFGMTK